METKTHHRSWKAWSVRGNKLTAMVGCIVLLMLFSLAVVMDSSMHSGDAWVLHPGDANEKTLQSVPPSMYPDLDKLDPLPPRPGENFITYGTFLDCMAARLRVDRHQRRELPIRGDEPFFPYLVAPITFELRELKAFTCNVTVPIKHLMIVVNYNLSSVAEFMDATAAAFNFTDRLQIRRFPRNRGYAGALNEAMRHALTFPFDEVPFFFMSNCDVRFSHRVLEEALPRINASAFAGKPLLESLRAEVATEPNEHTPPHFRDVPLRSTDGKHLLHTSASLPDRVRYMSTADRGAVFKNHPGFYFLNGFHQTAVWGYSRLTIETVGFFDENCYPAYYEDSDYYDRLRAFGLKSMFALKSRIGVIHYSMNMKKVQATNKQATSLGDTLAFLRGTSEAFEWNVSGQHLDGKVRIVNMNLGNLYPGYKSLLPPDAWFFNEKRRLTLVKLVHMSIQHHSPAMAASPLRSLQTIFASVPADLRKELQDGLDTYVNATELYREGNKLRPLSIEL